MLLAEVDDEADARGTSTGEKSRLKRRKYSDASDRGERTVCEQFCSKGAGLFQRAGQTMKQAGERGTSRYLIGIKS